MTDSPYYPLKCNMLRVVLRYKKNVSTGEIERDSLIRARSKPI